MSRIIAASRMACAPLWGENRSIVSVDDDEAGREQTSLLFVSLDSSLSRESR